jgi:hypothetical protein
MRDGGATRLQSGRDGRLCISGAAKRTVCVPGTPPNAAGKPANGGGTTVVGLLILLLLLALVFGGLGVFVAKTFLVVLLALALVTLLSGGLYVGRRGRY